MRASMPSAHPVGLTRVRSASHSSVALTAATSRSWPPPRPAQRPPGPVPQLAALECLPWRRRVRRHAGQAVVQYRARVGREAGQPARAVRGRLLRGGLDQLARLCFPAPPGREHHLGIRHRRVPGGLGDQMIFFDHQRRRGQLASEEVGSGQVVQRELQVHQGARFAGEPGLPGGQGMPDSKSHSSTAMICADSPTGRQQPPAGLPAPTSRARTSSSARVRAGAAAVCPCVNRSASPSSRTSTTRGGRDPAVRCAPPRPPPAPRRRCPGRRPTWPPPKGPPGMSRAPGQG